LFFPDPDPDFLPIPDPVVKKAPDPGSATLPLKSKIRGICELKYISYFFQCTVLSAVGEECVIATKVNTAVDK
jgi:hypothetical protein